MDVKNVPVTGIIPFAENAKKHDEVQIRNVMESISQFGFAQPLVVDRNNVLIIGHCRLIAAQRLGMEEVPVVCMDDLDEEQVAKLRLLDNKLNESEWDFDKLLDQVPTLDFDGFDIDWGFPEEIENPPFIENEDDIPEDVETRCKEGDVWILGDHRLICGDSTHIDVIEKLMDGKKVDLLITDPPYNVALGSKGGHPLRPSEAKQLQRRTDGLIIKNDSWESEEDFIRFLIDAFSTALMVMRDGAVFYIWYADNQALNFRTAARDAGMQVRQNLIWNKSTFTLGRQDYQWKHEPCLYGWKEGAAHTWNSDRSQTTVLDFDKPVRSELHPTMKPVALFSYQIKNSSNKGDNVLDLFGGSGTTLIACEELGRRAYLCELDPHYCDVIITRWEQATGKTARLEGADEEADDA